VLLSARSGYLGDKADFLFARSTFHRFSLRYPFTLAARRVIHGFAAFGIGFFLMVVVISQTLSQSTGTLPKYDIHSEMKTKGIVNEVDIVPLGSKKDLRELIVKSGEDKIHIYVCPQTFEQEMGISFTKGDEIAVTGSKVKHEETDVILARELVKGTDTLVFRDSKGNPVWDPRTGK
jgi:hypothetical protein